MHVTGKRGQPADVPGMLLAAAHGVPQMSDAPPCGDIEPECARQFLRRLRRAVIAPRAERYERRSVIAERKIAVHHAAYADISRPRESKAAPLLHVFFERCPAFTDGARYIVIRVRPYAVFETILPHAHARRKHFSAPVGHYCLYPSRSEFYTDRAAGSVFVSGRFHIYTVTQSVRS